MNFSYWLQITSLLLVLGWSLPSLSSDCNQLFEKSTPNDIHQKDENLNYGLGRRYELGTDVKKDLYKAAQLFEKAAEQEKEAGESIELQKYFVKFLKKHPEIRDSEKIKLWASRIINWLKTRSFQSNSFAALELGKLYEQGQIVERNTHKAMQFYEQAAQHERESKQGAVVAQFYAAQFYQTNSAAKNLKKAQYWTKRALSLLKEQSRNGDVAASLTLGEIYEEGKVIEQDMKKAIEFYTMAFEQGLESVEHRIERLKSKL